MTERLLRTAFLVALLSYLGFALADYLEPGLVSFVFSVHIWGVLALVFGVSWAVRTQRRPERSLIWTVLTIMLSLVLGWIFWREGGVFGDIRLLIAISAGALPWFAWWVLSLPKN